MTASFPRDLIRQEVANLPTYNAGLAMDRFKATYGIDCLAKLDSNESPLGPSPRAIEAMQQAAAGVARYPDGANMSLRALVGELTGTQPENVIFGNGSEDLIGALFRAVIRPQDHVVTICPSFGLHEFGALTFGARVTKVPFNDDWSFPVEALCQQLQGKPRVLIFSSPSNPAGPAISEQQFRRILTAADPETLICFDEAYVEFVAPGQRFDALAVLAESGKPAIVLRTFSKAYGLARGAGRLWHCQRSAVDSGDDEDPQSLWRERAGRQCRCRGIEGQRPSGPRGRAGNAGTRTHRRRSFCQGLCLRAIAGEFPVFRYGCPGPYPCRKAARQGRADQGMAGSAL